MDAGDQLAAAQHLHLGAVQAHLEAGVLRKEHLVARLEPGEKVLYPREAGYEVRLVRSPHRVRLLKREDLLARIHD